MTAAGTFLRRGGLLAGLALLLALTPAPAETRQQQLDREAEARLKKDVTYLASYECEGRGPTTEGINQAADYVAARFRQVGLRPGGTDGYFQPFRVAGAEGALTLAGPLGQSVRLGQGQHFNPLGYDQDG